MFGRKRREFADQVSAAAAGEILRLLMAKRLIEPGDAAACLRGIANLVVARSYDSGLGEAGRSIAKVLIMQADQLNEAVRSHPVVPFHNNA